MNHIVVSIGDDDSKPWGDIEVRVHLSHVTISNVVKEYLGIDVTVNLHIHIEAIVAWMSSDCAVARILGVDCSILYIASLVKAFGIMGPTMKTVGF